MRFNPSAPTPPETQVGETLIPERPAAVGRRPKLSQRQADIVQRVAAAGGTYGRVAVDLGLSKHTIGAVVSQVRVKLGFATTAEMYELARNGGLKAGPL